MRKIAIASIFLGAFAVLALSDSPARAAFFQTWVSGTGSDADNNTCGNQSTPCKNLDVALANVVPGGKIHVLSGSYLPALITISVEIIADEGATILINAEIACGSISAAICINAGPSDKVRIRGLRIDQLGRASPGIMFIGGKGLHLENCTLLTTGTSASALQFVPAAAADAGPIELSVRNSTIGYDHGGLATSPGGNVLIAPRNGLAVAALFDSVHMDGGLYGIRADNSAGSGLIRVDVRNSVAKGNTNNGFLAVGTGANPVHFMIDHSTADNNAAYGAIATGAQAFMILTNSTLMGNGTGLAQQSGATVASTGTNTINFNTTNSSGTITPIAPK